MDKITENTSFYELSKMPEFKDVYRYIPPGGQFRKGLGARVRIKAFAKIWDINPVVDGLNHMKEYMNRGIKVFYELASKEQMEQDPTLVRRVMFHFPVKEKSKFMIVLPGGGYQGVVHFLEGFPNAKKLNDMGYHAFIVNYRTGKNASVPNPMDDLAAAVKYIIDNADLLNVDISDYAVMGFSAGGHLCASFGSNNIGYTHYSLQKPACLILAYPVITMGEYTHRGSRNNLLGKDKENQEMRDKYSVEKHADGSFPPSFIWQCRGDHVVPLQNTEMLAEQLKKAGVPYEYEIFEQKGHGLGLVNVQEADTWLERAVKFWQSL